MAATTSTERAELRPIDQVHDVASAAARCLVCPDTIRAWIADGMKATPVARRGKCDRRKQFRIKDSWLMEWMDRRAREHAEAMKRPASSPRKGRGAARPIGPIEDDADDPIGAALVAMGRNRDGTRKV